EDNPVIPVIWQNRLFVFWLRILKQFPLDAGNMPTSADDTTHFGQATPKKMQEDVKSNAGKSTMVDIQAVLCWSEYYNGKWQATKTSDINLPAMLGSFDSGGARAFNRSALALSSHDVTLRTPAGASALTINIISSQIARDVGFLL